MFKKFLFLTITVSIIFISGLMGGGNLLAYPSTPCETGGTNCTDWYPTSGYCIATFQTSEPHCCYVQYHYRYRVCDDQVDVDIYEIRTYNGTQACAYCESYSDVALIDSCFRHFWMDKPWNICPGGVNIYPQCEPLHCYDHYRLSFGTCWCTKTWNDGGISWCPDVFPPPPDELMTRMLQTCSGTDCCFQDYTICFDAYGKPTFTYVNSNSSSYTCYDNSSECPNNYQYLFPRAPDWTGECTPMCDKVLIWPRINDNNVNIPADNITINSKNLKETITFNVTEESLFIIHIFDILGNKITSLEVKCSPGANVQDIDISSYLTGSYIINILKDNTIIKTDKFSVVK